MGDMNLEILYVYGINERCFLMMYCTWMYTPHQVVPIYEPTGSHMRVPACQLPRISRMRRIIVGRGIRNMERKGTSMIQTIQSTVS